MGRAVICVHGAFCGGWAFEAFRAPLEAAGREVRAPNLPHHQPGADLDALAREGVRDYARALAAYMSRFDEPPVLMGHSMGGLVAQIAATMAPTAGLVLLAPSSPWGVAPTGPEEAAAAVALFALGDFWNRPVAPVFGPARDYSLDRMSRAEQSATFARFVPESGRAAFETLNWPLDPTMAASAPANRIDCPVLCIAGEGDRLNPPASVAAIASRFPRRQATMVTMKGMSHWLVGEPGWEAVADTALDWLESRGL